MSLSVSFGAIAAPNVEPQRQSGGGNGLAPEFRLRQTDVFAPAHALGQRTEQELWEAIQPKTIQDAYAELNQLFGNDVERQYQETIQILQQQYDMLEARQRELERAMNEPIDPLQQMMPMLMLGAFSGDMQTALMGALMQMLMTPQLEQQKRDRYWKAITEVLGEKNKVVSSLRAWESLSLRERQELLRQARAYTGQLNTTALRALDTFARRRLEEFRLGLRQERDQIALQYRARGQYFRAYNDMLRVLEMYHDPNARAEILQAFTPSLSQMAEAAGFDNPPHLQIATVLQYPSLRATQAVTNMATAAMRGEINQVMFHSAQLGLIQKQLAIAKAKQMLQNVRSGRTERLSLSALATIYRFSHFIEQQAYADPEVMRELKEAYGDNWVQAMRDLRARISAQIIGLAEPDAPTQAVQQAAQNAAFDETQFNRYLLRVFQIQGQPLDDVNDMPLEPDAIEFLQDLYGQLRTTAPMEDGVTTLSMNQFVQQIYQRALASIGSHLNWDNTLGGLPAPTASSAFPSSAPSGSKPVSPELAPAEGSGTAMPVAVRPLSSILYGNATSTNILDLNALAQTANAGATVQVPIPSPEVNRTLNRIQERHLVRFRSPSGQRLYEVSPLLGIAQPFANLDDATLRRYYGLQAHRVFQDIQSGQVLIGLSVPIASHQVQTEQGVIRYDLSPELRRVLYDPATRTDADIVLIKNADGSTVPVMMISVLYPVQVQGRVQGYRVPALLVPLGAFGTMFQNWIEDAGIDQYRLPNRYQPLSANDANRVAPWLTAVRALFAQGGAWEQLLQRVQDTILRSGLPEAEQRAQLQRIWQEFRQTARNMLNGQDLFRSVRWLPITYY